MSPWLGATTVASTLDHRALGYRYDTQPETLRPRNRIGVLQTNANLYVKEGPLDAAWTLQAPPAGQSSPIESFALEGDRIGVLYTDGNLYVKEGPLDAGWTWEGYPVQSFVLEGDRIGVLHKDGNVFVKEGPLDAAWTWESWPVASFLLLVTNR